MPAPRTTYAEAFALARELAPLLASIPRIAPARTTARRKPAEPGATPYGLARAIARWWHDLPPAQRPPAEQLAATHHVRLDTLKTCLSDERRLRLDPVRRAHTERVERLAREFLTHSPHATDAQRRAFIRLHGLRALEFRHARARIELVRQLDRNHAPNHDAA